jgi:hypothetical protein
MKAGMIDMQNITKQDLMQLIEFHQAVLHLRNNGLNEKRAMELVTEALLRQLCHA